MRPLLRKGQVVGIADVTVIEYLEERAACRFEAEARLFEKRAKVIAFILVEPGQAGVEIRVADQEIGNTVLHGRADRERRELMYFSELRRQRCGRNAIAQLPARRVKRLAE